MSHLSTKDKIIFVIAFIVLNITCTYFIFKLGSF